MDIPNAIAFIFAGVIDFIYNIPSLIIEGIKNLFVPRDNFFSDCITEIKSNISAKISYEQYIDVFGSLKDGSYYDGEKNLDIKIEGYKVSEDLVINQDFIDFDIITKYKDTWHSWIRGIIYILITIYNVNEFVKLLRGYNVAANVVSHVSSSGGGKK